MAHHNARIVYCTETKMYHILLEYHGIHLKMSIVYQNTVLFHLKNSPLGSRIRHLLAPRDWAGGGGVDLQSPEQSKVQTRSSRHHNSALQPHAA
jgi:hypothetical protein